LGLESRCQRYSRIAGPRGADRARHRATWALYQAADLTLDRNFEHQLPHAAAFGLPTAPRYTPSVDLLERITRDPAVMGGRPCIRGMRVTVGAVVGLLAAGRSREEILEAYPYLESDDIRAALSYAAWRTEEVELPLT
jgi:uncharacterized protein (DUF433 family)